MSGPDDPSIQPFVDDLTRHLLRWRVKSERTIEQLEGRLPLDLAALAAAQRELDMCQFMLGEPTGSECSIRRWLDFNVAADDTDGQ